MTFTHLQVQSGYSLMDSTIKIQALIQRAKELNYSSIALTDKEVMSGSISFYRECRNNGIKPIIGMKITVYQKSGDFPVILLAKTNVGYRNLMKISTEIQFRDTPITLDRLATHSTGIIAIAVTSHTPWAEAFANRKFEEVDKQLTHWFEAFGKDSLYIGVQDVDLHKERQIHHPVKEWTEQTGGKAVALGDVKYLHKEDSVAYHCLRAIHEGRRVSEKVHEAPAHHYLKSIPEMTGFFEEWWPEVIESTIEIENQCHVDLDLEQQLLPSYPTPKGKKADDYLRELCREALDLHYQKNKENALKRLDHELDVITNMNFSDYFLIVWDFVTHAREKGIQAGPGRGSAAGSIVAYLLGITKVDPLEYGLLFERFLNPERITMPDIDIDFPDHRREEVIEYVTEKYGKSHVAQICTFGTFAVRSVLRELFKSMGVDESDAAFILKQIPKSGADSVVSAVKRSEELKEYIRGSSLLRGVFQVAAKLDGLPRHVSTHAAGLIISEKPLVEYTALLNSNGPAYLTQLAMGELEEIGLLKIDLLGLRNLSFMEKIEQRITSYKDKEFSIDKIPLEDEKTYRLLSEGRTNGVFQLESHGMKSVLKRLKPTRFEDIVAVNALYRPGPMEYIPTYINRKHGKEPIQYPHPDIEPILKPTYGVLVYQEQIMQVAQKVGGYTLGEADLLRRAVSKKQGALLQQQKKQFLNGSQRKGYEPSVGEELFEWIVKFSNYGFNKSHAVAYSVISYKLAFIKAHYPAYFFAELMNLNSGDQQKVTAYIREAKDNGISVHGPSVNRSSVTTRDEKGAVRLGLMAIKGVGYQAAAFITEERKEGYYKSLNDFCLRLISSQINRSVIESLILAGAFDDFDKNRARLLANIDQALEQGELFKEFQGQSDLFGQTLEFEDPETEIEPFPVLKKLALEKEVLGTYLSEHPLESNRKALRKEGIVSLNQAFMVKNKKVVVAAVVESIKEIRTKRGEPMAFAELSDESIEIDGVLFPNVYREVKPWITEQALVKAEGKLEERNGKKQILISRITRFEPGKEVDKSDQRLFVKVSQDNEKTSILFLQKLSSYFPGNTPVLIFRAEDRKTTQLDEQYSLTVSRECLKRLYDHFGREFIAVRSRNENGK